MKTSELKLALGIKAVKTPEHPIFLESIEYIRSQLVFKGLDGIHQSVLERVIHSSGDFSLQPLLNFSAGSCDHAINALKSGTKILTDTFMAEAAISPMAKRTLNIGVECILRKAPESLDSTSITRTSIGMRKMWLDYETKGDLLESPIVVIGSSPTALMTLLDLIDEGRKVPSLIIGMPVGFIGVSESKKRLLNSEHPFIVLEGSKGGAAVAAAAMNALLRAAES